MDTNSDHFSPCSVHNLKEFTDECEECKNRLRIYNGSVNDAKNILVAIFKFDVTETRIQRHSPSMCEWYAEYLPPHHLFIPFQMNFDNYDGMFGNLSIILRNDLSIIFNEYILGLCKKHILEPMERDTRSDIYCKNVRNEKILGFYGYNVSTSSYFPEDYEHTLVNHVEKRDCLYFGDYNRIVYNFYTLEQKKYPYRNAIVKQIEKLCDKIRLLNLKKKRDDMKKEYGRMLDEMHNKITKLNFRISELEYL